MLTPSARILIAALTAGLALAATARAETGAIPEACRSKTNDCEVCSLDDGGKVVACSLPGIACAKGEWRCNDPAMVQPLPGALPEATPAPAPAAPGTAPQSGQEAAQTPAPSPAP